jgi:hypothetical protein
MFVSIAWFEATSVHGHDVIRAIGKRYGDKAKWPKGSRRIQISGREIVRAGVTVSDPG